ncbi:MAG TPA: M12 family metallo-peptidase, partial [Nocardioides sp.]
MPTHRTLAGIAGLCAIALAATTAPTTAVAAPGEPDRPAQLLDSPGSARTVETPGGERVRAVSLDAAALHDTVTGDRVDLSLFDDAAVTALIDHHETVDGIETWSGGIVGEDGSFSAVEVNGVHHLNIASVEHGTFEVAQDRSGDYVMTEAGMPPGGNDVIQSHADDDHATGSRSGRRAAPGAMPQAQPRDAAGLVDVAIVYPASLVAQMGADAMQAQFAQGIAQTNEAFRNSGIPTQIRLVGTRQVSGTQSTDLETNLRALGRPGDGVFDEAQALREETHADLVSLWLSGSVPGGNSCGIAYLGGLDPQVQAERDAWSVVYAASCATQFRVFSHELGHNFSGNHNADATQPPTGGKAYARGYVDVAARTVTLMSYYNTCDRPADNDFCTRIGYYSSPDVVAAGRPQGTSATNNVQAINEQIDAVANYRQSQIHPGSVAIAGTPRFGATVTATAADWAPAVSFGYQWIIDGVAVPGLTGQSIKLGSADIGKSLAVQVTGSAPYYT